MVAVSIGTTIRQLLVLYARSLQWPSATSLLSICYETFLSNELFGYG